MVAKAADVVAVEIDGPLNEAHYFRPLGRRVRGRFDAHRVAGDTGRLVQAWPDPIPGQRIGVDVAAGEGFIEESLCDPQHAALKAKAERVGAVGPPREVFAGVHVPTWLFWLRQAVEAGIARIVQGTLPATIDGSPQREFITPKAADPIDRLAVAMERQNELLLKLLTKRNLEA